MLIVTDLEREVQRMQRMMQSLQWLPRVKIIVRGNRVITACKASLRNQLEAPLPAMMPPVKSVVKRMARRPVLPESVRTQSFQMASCCESTTGSKKVAGYIDKEDWLVDGKRFKGPCTAAGNSITTKSGDLPALNGSGYWEVKRSHESYWIALNDLRKK